MLNEEEQEALDHLKGSQSKKKMVWCEKTGHLTPISQMSDFHLESVIRIIKGSIKVKKYWRTQYLPFLEEEWRYRALIKRRKEFEQLCPPPSKSTRRRTKSKS